MLFDNLSIGLDIATAGSVIAAAVLFIKNSINSNRREREERAEEKEKERKERKKEIIKKYIFGLLDDLLVEHIKLFQEINNVENRLRSGETTMDLNPLRDLIYNPIFIFEIRIRPISMVYGDGRFIELAEEYRSEMNKWLQRFQKLTSPDSNERWDFDEVMYQPTEISDKFNVLLLSEYEKLIDSM